MYCKLLLLLYFKTVKLKFKIDGSCQTVDLNLLKLIVMIFWVEVFFRQTIFCEIVNQKIHTGRLPINMKSLQGLWLPEIFLAVVISNFEYPSPEHIGNIDDSLMLWSITSMMHEFYIEHRLHWWTFDIVSRLHPCFQCFSTLKPATFHLLNIKWFIDDTTVSEITTVNN